MSELTVNDAVGLLNAGEEQTENQETEAPAEAAPEPDEEQSSDPDQEDVEAPDEASDDDAAEEAEEPIDPPHFWTAEEKARFAELPRDVQELLIAKDKEAQRITNQRLEEAAKTRKAYEDEAKALSELKARAEQAVTHAEQMFVDRWSEWTPQAWAELARTNQAQYIELKAQFEEEQAAVQQSRAARDAAAQVERARWLEEQSDLLKSYAPELADPVEGSKRKQELAEYLISQGAKPQDLADISAAVTALAWKAMQFDRLKTQAKAPRPAPKPVKPTSSAPPSVEREAQKAKNRFFQTGRLEDALGYLDSKG